MSGNLLQQRYNTPTHGWQVAFWERMRWQQSDLLILMVFLTSILLGLCMGSGVAISMQYGKRAQDSMRRSVF